MSHRNAPLTPEGRRRLCERVDSGRPVSHVAAEAGQLQLNAFEPVIAYSLFRSVAHLIAACGTLEVNCIRGITANRERLRASVENSIGIVTALNPYIGYAAATEVALEAHATGRGVYELVLAKGLMPRAQLDAVLRPENLTRPQPLVAQV